MAGHPKISVCMSMHNVAPYLRECIDSILCQTYGDFELLIVDDGSEDESGEIVRSYSDSRIKLITLPHDFINSLNTLLNEAQGEYIARMDADDIMHPDRLRVQLEYLEKHPDTVAVSSQAIKIDTQGKPVGQISHGSGIMRITSKMMCEDNYVCNPSTMIRAEIVKKEGLRYEKGFIYAEDYRFWCRVISDYGYTDCLPDQLIKYRVSENQVTAVHFEDTMRAARKIKANLIDTIVARANPGYFEPEPRKSNKELTLIIPFLNEGEEVENTVRSFRKFGGDEVEILLINDRSYDSYPYMERLKGIPNVTYILNNQRLGVAGSRDKGVRLCKTPYFLLLDSHMRAYDKSWLREILELLRDNDHRILCCQNLPLYKDSSGKVEENKDIPLHYGARLSIKRGQPGLGIHWIENEKEPNKGTEIIPAVLGAGYAASVRYWKKIGGLRGLLQYGCDEQLLSLKTWLEGGTCILLKNVKFGHIYRKQMPYEVNHHAPLYNNLFISETLLPLRERIMSRASAFVSDKKNYNIILQKVRDYINNNPDLFRYKPEMTQRFFRLLELSSRPNSMTRQVYEGIFERIDEIRDMILNNMPDEAGVFTGKMGLALWLMVYAETCGSIESEKKALNLIREVKENLPFEDFSFGSGLSGIGWVLVFMRKKKLWSGSEGVLNSIDEFIFKSCKPTADTSFERGTSGILAYVCVRSEFKSFHQLFGSYFPTFDFMADEIIKETNNPVSAYYALLWKELRQNNFSVFPEINLKDWIKPSNFVARDKRFWAMSLYDGVPASSINVLNSNFNFQ